MNCNFKKIVLIFYVFFSSLNSEITYKNFIESFIQHYEFNAEGRYAHEYHPALLERTAISLDELEKEISKNNLNLTGRIIICGYEEHGVPSYYPDFRRSEIDDEASSKNNAGWSLRLHNRFGFMTGFLFKDFDYYAKQWFIEKNNIFEHIDAEDLEIFNDKATIFQEHAFGEALPLIFQAQIKIARQFKQQNYRAIFQELIKFWNCLYKGGIKVGNKQFAGTQDILFSIEYAKHLVRSDLPLFKFYVGPDITYPVEVSAIQAKDATLHAQSFVKKMAQNLLSEHKKSTAYIFCSFVDGVGKSTMLGNIKNYLKFGSDVQNYVRVDNSSSQLAEVFRLNENVFIADLPAQVSHFTYKPDGLVYVGVGREISQELIEDVQDFIRQNKEKFKNQYDNLLIEVKNIIKEEGYFSEELNNPDSPEKTLLKNIFLTKKERTNRWIPFDYKDKSYVFNYYEPYQVRVLTPLGYAQSEGLKNIETEQMLFFDGVRLPFPYSYFISDLVKKLKDNGIEDVVFVDFVSMYPRSSRENIRVNYLLQQMSFLDKDFDSKFSLYRDFVNEAELFSILKNDHSYQKILNSYRLETLTRLALFKIIVEREYGDLEGFSLSKLTDLINLQINQVLHDEKILLDDLTYKKLKSETFNLEKIYGLTKNFINVQQFSFAKAIAFSDYLSNLFAKKIFNESLNELWQDPGTILDDDLSIDDGEIDKVMITNQGVDVRVLYRFDLECKDEHMLTSFLRTLRCIWYVAISNLIDVKEFGFDEFTLEKEKYFVPPVFLKKGANNKVYLLQRLFDPWTDDVPKDTTNKIEKQFNLLNLKNAQWGEFKDNAYCLDWKSLGTNSKIFAFDFDNSTNQKFFWYKTETTFIVQNYQKEVDQPLVMPTEEFYEKLKNSFSWKRVIENFLNEARKNGNYKNKKETEDEEKDKKDDKKENEWGNFFRNKDNNKIKVYLGLDQEVPAARLVVKLLATLELVVKDPDADIGLRTDNKDDFKAALKTVEKLMLPKYFGIIFEDNLFDNYEYIEPCLFW